ncbi:MAG: hypothetical protein ACI959_000766 [Limisphaerales bacterium]|jgi:hypothetical protein
MEYRAVYTGDIVNSRKLDASERKKMLDVLHFQSEKLKSSNPESSFEINRGDAFQAIVQSNIQDILREVLKLRVYLKSTEVSFGSLDMRCGIGIGPVEYPGKTLAETDGTAFRMAGEALDNMPAQKKIAIQTTDTEINAELDVAMTLLEAIISRWTNTMAEVIYYTLEGMTQTAIGEKLGINQSAVNHRLRLAKYEVIPPVLKRFENLITKLTSKAE